MAILLFLAGGAYSSYEAIDESTLRISLMTCVIAAILEVLTGDEIWGGRGGLGVGLVLYSGFGSSCYAGLLYCWEKEFPNIHMICLNALSRIPMV